MDDYKYYHPTPYLRFIKKEIVSEDCTVNTRVTLQQKWISNISGLDDEWRDVELVDDFD